MNIRPLSIILLAGGMCLSSSLFGEHASFSSYEGYKTCKMCHGTDFDQHATDLMASIHWTWEGVDSYSGQKTGKINMINNYCVAVPSNEPRCTSCHIGIGWSDGTFDTSDPANIDKIDCLVCHDGSGTYSKLATGSGSPTPGLDYGPIFSSIQMPDRDNCGACHFFGGGGDAVKHGTLDSTMGSPTRDTDVHMGGQFDMTCVSCHKIGTENKHEFTGSRYSSAADNMLCQECHTATPHGGFMDNHAERVACQTCHIPEFARGGKATKMFWDWSTAGNKNDDGTDRVIKDADGNIIYHSKKGTFIWEDNVVPEYVWFNGNVTHITLDDTVMQGEIAKINTLHGDIDDPNAYIFPVKRFTGVQPYDSGANTLAIPHLFPYPSEKADPSTSKAYWMKYNWETSLEEGQASVGRTYVGPAGFIDTEYTWISNHMVAPKDQSLQCVDCHTKYGRIDFSAMGYEATRATFLQNLKQDEVWAGYVIADGPIIDTGDWMGFVNIGELPWVYVYALEGWFYMPEDGLGTTGGWAFSPN